MDIGEAVLNALKDKYKKEAEKVENNKEVFNSFVTDDESSAADELDNKLSKAFTEAQREDIEQIINEIREKLESGGVGGIAVVIADKSGYYAKTACFPPFRQNVFAGLHWSAKELLEQL